MYLMGDFLEGWGNIMGVGNIDSLLIVSFAMHGGKKQYHSLSDIAF
ncbi:MAG: hypothetical protein JWQ54_4543 [Mucilaginibacter sp.]|nr:hypothetical protein [Mucilaginibacter sp.]